MSTIPDEFPPVIVSQNPRCSNSSIVKITVFVTGLLLIGSAVACHIFQVNAIVVYTTGAGGGLAILSVVIANIIQWGWRTDSRAEINRVREQITHLEGLTENAKWIDCAQKGDIEAIRAGLSNNTISNLDELLHKAAYFGHADLVDILLQKGANPKVQDTRGYTAIHNALLCEDNLKGLNTMRKLLAKDPSLALDKKDDAITTLHMAARHSSVQDEEVHKQKIELLIQNSAEVNAADDAGYTPLYFAVCTIIRQHDPSMVVINFLVAKGAKVNRTKKYDPLEKVGSIHPDWYQTHKEELSKLLRE